MSIVYLLSLFILLFSFESTKKHSVEVGVHLHLHFGFEVLKKQEKQPIFFFFVESCVSLLTSTLPSSGPSSLVVGGSDFFSAMVDCGEEVLSLVDLFLPGLATY